MIMLQKPLLQSQVSKSFTNKKQEGGGMEAASQKNPHILRFYL